jgi:hypothetical protein
VTIKIVMVGLIGLFPFIGVGVGSIAADVGVIGCDDRGIPLGAPGESEVACPCRTIDRPKGRLEPLKSLGRRNPRRFRHIDETVTIDLVAEPVGLRGVEGSSLPRARLEPERCQTGVDQLEQCLGMRQRRRQGDQVVDVAVGQEAKSAHLAV